MRTTHQLAEALSGCIPHRYSRYRVLRIPLLILLAATSLHAQAYLTRTFSLAQITLHPGERITAIDLQLRAA